MENELEKQIGAVLKDPAMMQKLMTMAQSLSQSGQVSSESKDTSPDIDLAMAQRLAGLAGQSGIDQQQRSLLSALTPYLSGDRLRKLENAMRAARMTKLATSFLATAKHGNGR